MLRRMALSYHSTIAPQPFAHRPLMRAVLALCLAGSLGACSWLGSFNPWNGDTKALKEVADPSTVPPEELYNHGVDALNAKNYNQAVKQFDAVEQYYPYSTWAVNAQLMQGFTQYTQAKYTDAIGTLDRFIQLHPTHRDIAYAYYIRALSYYEQITDVTRDQQATRDAMAALQEVVNRFPDTSYGRDARLKIDLGRDHLAGHEMEIGRWYEKQKLYSAALGRFQTVVDQYQTTNHVAEALHRMTEIYLLLGLNDQARRSAAVLGHNYPGSEWYEDSYNALIATGDVQGEPVHSGTPDEPGFFTRAWKSVF
jgi:outer membrane protein assembly factor BamD